MSAKNSCTFFLIIDFSSLWSTPIIVNTSPKMERGGGGGVVRRLARTAEGLKETGYSPCGPAKADSIFLSTITLAAVESRRPPKC